MLYTPYRAQDLRDLIPSVTTTGRVYESVMRIGIGGYLFLEKYFGKK